MHSPMSHDQSSQTGAFPSDHSFQAFLSNGLIDSCFSSISLDVL